MNQIQPNKRIDIEWLNDTHDCETCGTSWAEGAKVYLDDKLILECIPVAHCFGGDNYSQEDIFKAILEYLGYNFGEPSNVDDVGRLL